MGWPLFEVKRSLALALTSTPLHCRSPKVPLLGGVVDGEEGIAHTSSI